MQVLGKYMTIRYLDHEGVVLVCTSYQLSKVVQGTVMQAEDGLCRDAGVVFGQSLCVVVAWFLSFEL